MAELDRYERTVGRQWIDVLNLARSQATANEVAEEAISRLAKTLNQNRGIPKLDRVFDIVESTLEFNLQIAVLDRLAESNGHMHTAVAIREAKRSCLESLGRHGTVTSRERLCRRILFELMETRCFATTRVAMQAEGLFGSPREADEWGEELRAACDDRLESLACLLSSDPSLARLPVPRYSRKKKSLAELIHEPLAAPIASSLREGQRHESR